MSLDYQEETPQDSGNLPAGMETAGGTGPAIPYYSIVLIACIVVVSVVQIGTNLEASIDLAGFNKPLFLDGEYWRILTGAALHGGIVHLLFNSYALFVLGRLIEMLSNRAHLPIVFLVAAVGGGILSLLFSPYATSVGASGGVIGFLGYLTVYGYKRRKLLSNSFLKSMLFNVGFIAVFGIFIIPRVDNLGHLGGLIAGAVYGLFQIPSDVYKDPRVANKAFEVAGLVSIGIFIAVSIFSVLLILRIV